MDPISIALGAASIVPGIVRWLGGDSAGDAAQKVVDVAQRVTGVAEPAAAVDALKADPAAALRFKELWFEHERALYEQETRRLQEVNQTIRTEAASGDAYVRRMRPTFGYAMAFTWLLQMLAVSYVVVFRPADAAAVLHGIAETTALWGIGLTVVGVYVYRRSSEKGVPGLLPGR